ncbi:unnamed protein product [Lampetra fluviatilis]
MRCWKNVSPPPPNAPSRRPASAPSRVHRSVSSSSSSMRCGEPAVAGSLRSAAGLCFPPPSPWPSVKPPGDVHPAADWR